MSPVAKCTHRSGSLPRVLLTFSCLARAKRPISLVFSGTLPHRDILGCRHFTTTCMPRARSEDRANVLAQDRAGWPRARAKERLEGGRNVLRHNDYNVGLTCRRGCGPRRGLDAVCGHPKHAGNEGPNLLRCMCLGHNATQGARWLGCPRSTHWVRSPTHQARALPALPCPRTG